jgi:hypothetical protein
VERARRNIAKTISKHLGVLRKLKFKMNRQNLEKMLEVFFCDAYYVMVPSQFRNIKNQSL